MTHALWITTRATMDPVGGGSTQPYSEFERPPPSIYRNLKLPKIPEFRPNGDDEDSSDDSEWESEWVDDDDDGPPSRRPSIELNEAGMPKHPALKKSSSHLKSKEEELEEALANSKKETEVYRRGLKSQIQITKKALLDANQLSHALITTKSALEESMATMVREIQTQSDQIKNLKETVAMSEEELELCHKMLNNRDERIARTEGELDGLERVHSDLMDARETTIFKLEKDLDIYQKVYGDMLDEKDLQIAELEEELRVLKETHSELLTLRQKEKETNALLESVYSRQMTRTDVEDQDGFEKVTEQETHLDLLLTALTSSQDDVLDLRNQIEASTLFESSISLPTTATGSTAADSSMGSEESPDATTIRLLRQKIQELEQKNTKQNQTIVSLRQQAKNSDAWKLEMSGAKVLL